MTSEDSRKLVIDVRCYSGYKANERPESFSFKDRVYKVVEIIDRWYGQDYAYFKLKADDGNLYILRYSVKMDRWELHYFEKAGNSKGQPC